MVLNKYKYRLFFFNTIIFICVSYNTAFSQNLCDNPPANSEVGAFEIVGGVSSGCSPFNVQLNDLSGGTDIRYDFYYADKTVSQLDKTGNQLNNNAYFSSTNINTYTILQYGKKNGKDMYACKKGVTVRPNSQPKFSYSYCSNNVEITIPKSPENIYDRYEITWNNNPITKVSVNAAQIPFTIVKNVTLPADLKVEGFPSSGTGCTSIRTYKALELNLTNFPNGISPDFDPNIDEMYSESRGLVKLKLKGSENPVGYDLNIRENIDNAPFTTIKTGVLPGEFNIQIPDSTKSYCFMVRSKQDCAEYSAEACTINLQDLKIINNNVNLNWNEYPNKINNAPPLPNFFSLEKKLYVEIIKGNNLKTIKIGDNDNNYLDIISACLESSKYRIKIEITGLLYQYRYKSTIYSNWQKIEGSQTNPPPILNSFATINNSEKIEINFKDDITWPFIKERFYLLDNLNIKIDSLTIPPYRFTNSSPINLEKKCFKVIYKDQCGNISIPSQEICTIFLQTTDKEKLSWSTKAPFSNDNISNFELVKFDELFNTPNIDKVISKNDSTTIANLSLFENEARFKIKANSSTGVESYSNLIKIPITTQFFLPTAFSSNNDRINDSFQLIGNLGTIKSMKFRIFDRWGSEIVTLTDPNQKWDGTINGNKLKSDYFNYLLTIELTNGEKIKKEGKIVNLH